MITSQRIGLDTQSRRLDVCGMQIQTAPTVQALHSALGAPGRIIDGGRPAPMGHRNNQIHVYDAIGMTFIEHHYTRLLQCATCWLDATDPQFRFTPLRQFSGQLEIDGVRLPVPGTEDQFISSMPQKPKHSVGGLWTVKDAGGFSISITARGRRLPSGRRSKTREVLSVAIGWPHDNWLKPVD